MDNGIYHQRQWRFGSDNLIITAVEMKSDEN